MAITSCDQKENSPEAIQVFAQKGIDSTQAAIILNRTLNFPPKTQFSIGLVTDTSTTFVGVLCANDSIFNIENHDSYFEIGGISRIFTTALLASFVRANKIGLDDSISDFISFPLKDSVEISFRQLATHTSGLPNVPTGTIFKSLLNMENPYKNFDEAELESYLKNNLSLSSKPGEKYSESTLGMGVLSHTLSAIGDKPFTDLIQSHIFEKYQLKNATYDQKSISTVLIPGRNSKGKPAHNWDMAALKGAGGIYATASDLVKFAKAHCNGSDSTLALTRNVSFVVDDKTAIGLGWKIIKSETGNNLYSQTGSTGGYSSAILLNPGNCTAVVVLSNVAGTHDSSSQIEKLCTDLFETISKADSIGIAE